MAQAFNLTAQLNLRGPSNVRQIVSDVKKQLGTITGDIKFNIDPASINNTSRLSKSLQELNANLANVSTNARAASSAIKSFGQSVTSISGSSNKLSSNLDKTTKSADNVGSSLTKTAKNVSVARTEMEEFGRQSALAVRRFAAFSAVTGVFFSLNRAINSGLKSFIEFDKELVKLQQVTGKNAEGLQDLQNEITRLSINLGVSSDSLIQVSSTLAQAGLSATETRAALEALARSSLAPSFDDINQTVEGSIALMRQFGISAKELEKALGSVNSVAAAFAVESSDIIAAIQRTGGVFANASKGVSEGTDALNEFIAVFTSVRATTRESAETIATGLRTIFTRIQRQGTIDALRDFGVTLTDAEGKFVGAYKAVQLLSEGLNRIDPRDIKFSQIVEELGGFRQIGKVIPLIQQFATAQEALKVAQAGQGSLAADALKAQLSLANQIAKVREEFLSLIRSLGQSDTFQTLARGALGFASGLIKITSALKGVLPALAILGAGASLRGITQFAGGFIGGLKKVPKGQEGEEQPGIARSIGSNLGSSLVGAKTEQASRDIEKNTEALNGISDKLTSLTTTIQSLIDLSSKEKEQVIDPSLVTNLISSISTLNDTINNQKLTSTDSGQDPTQRKMQAQQIRNIRADKTLNSTEKKIRIQQIQNEKNKSSGIDATAIQELSASINTFNTNFNAISNSLSTYNTTLQNNTNTLSSNNSSLENVYAALVNLDATLDRKDFGGGGPTTASGGGRILGFSRGGSVPGSGKGDKVPALLEPGEVVMSNRAVDKYGRGSLERMNKGGKPNRKVYTSDEGDVQKSHIGEDIEITKKMIKNYIGAGYKSKKFLASAKQYADLSRSQLEEGDFDIKKLIDSMELKAKDRITLKLPLTWNQALRKNNRDLVSKKSLSQFLSGRTDLFSGQYNKLSISDKSKKDAALALSKEVKQLPPNREAMRELSEQQRNIASFDTDNELNSLKNVLVDKLGEAEYIDLLFKSPKIDKSERGGRSQSRAGAKKNKIGMFIGGKIRKFADGGVAQRNLGYIDYDVIANPANEAIVSKGMEAAGVTGPRLYADYLTDLAVKKRKENNLSKLKAIYGVAGAGKTTLARGQGTDKASLRETTRFPILSPEDINKASEVIVLSSSVSQKKLDEIFSNVDRAYTLSTTTASEKERIRSQRESRDTTGIGLEGRKPGGTTGVENDTAISEALLSDRLGKKSVVLGRSSSGKLRRKTDNELVEVIKKKIGVAWGGFAPMTLGHESIVDSAKAMGISPEDFLYIVGSNEGIKLGDPSSYRTAIFNQDSRVLLAKAGAGTKGATVLPKEKGFEIPLGFDMGESDNSRRKVLLPGSGSVAFVGDEKSEEILQKYRDAGYKTKSIGRMGDISGTMVRDLISQGNLGELQKVLSPNVYDLISNNIGRIQNRANILPSLIEQVQQSQAVKLADVEKQIKSVGISRIDQKKMSDPEYAAKAEALLELRTLRDKIKSSGSFEPYKLLDKLAADQPEKYGLDFTLSKQTEPKPIRTVGKRQTASLGGLIQKLAEGGTVESIAARDKKSIQTVVLEQLSSFGDASGVKKILGLGSGDREAGAILNAGNIKAGKNIEKAITYINRALAKTGKADAAKEAKEAAMRKVAIAGLFPLDYNKDFSDWKLEDGREIYGYVRGFQSSFLPQVEAMQEANRATRQKFAEDIQDTAALGGLGNKNIQGPIQPLAIDFDETLALGTKMLDENGEEDLPAYADRKKVMESLAQARPTSLAKRLASIEQKNPGYVRMYSRILTARPQSTADIIASTLNRFGLPYLEQDITGVSQGLGTNIAKAKAANVARAEKLIDDSEENIRATMAAGKSTFRYGEVPELKGSAEEKFGQSNIEGGLLEAALSQLLGYNINVDALQRNRAIDFPQGLGRGAQLFGLPPNIETEVKRTLDGDSFSKAREEFSRYFTENPQAYAKGGAATFGSGSFKFPKRISNAYVREMEKLLEQEQMEKVFSTYPGNERMIVDEEAVQKGYESPFSRELFINSFKDKISRNTVFERMGQFARVIGLPPTDFLSAIPTQLDFGVNYPATALFNKDPSGPGTRGLQGVDLTPYGYTEQDKQDLFGYTKLIEEKKKQILKTIKTSVTTYEDGSFGYDVALTEKLRAELDDLQKQQRSLIDKNNAAIKAAKESRLQSANQSGRGSVGIATNPFNTSQRQDYSILYHELTHQLFNSLRTKNAQSFEAYKAKVASLFSGNNDDVADAFDALVGNTGYNSADVAYGRSYKLSGLSSLMMGSAKKESFEKYVNSDPEYVPELRKTWAETQSTTNAKAFKPLNPRVNDVLLRGKISQDVIDKYEDNGKEEFLTTLIQKLPLLDENLREVLDSTLDDLLGGAGISRQKLSVGGLIGKLKDGGSVPALVSNGEAFVPPKLAKQIGYGKLERMNQADKNGMTEFSEGGISVFKGPGNGTSDSIPTNLPVGSFVIREKATKALGLNSGGAVGVRKFKDGDKVSYRKHATGIQAPMPDLGFVKTSAILLADSFRTTEQIISNGYSAWQEIDKVAPVLANALDRYFSTINGTVEDASLMMQSYRAVAVSLAKQGKSAAEIDAIMTNYIDALNKGIDAYQNPTPIESPKSAAPSSSQIPPDPGNTSTTPKTSLPRTPPPVPKSAEQKLAAVENEAIAQRIEAKQNIKSEYDPVYRGASSKEDKQAIQDDARSKFQAADATIQANKAAQQQAILQELLAQKAKEANQSTAEYISGLQQEIDARSVDIMEQDFSNALGPEAPSAPEARQQALNETISSRGLQAFNVPGLGEGTDLNSIIAQVSKNNDLAAEADKAKAAAATRAADALELMRLKAEQNGQTLSQYQSNLKQNILNLAKDLQKSAPGKISKFNETAVSLRGDINSGDEDKITKAKEQLAKQLADLGTNLESSQITTIIDDLAASMGDTDKTFVDIINNSQALQEAFKQSSTDATALQAATQKLSVSLGIPEEALQKLASSAELAASNLYDKNADSIKRMGSTIGKTTLGIAAIGSVAASTIKSLGGSENKDTAVLSAGIGSFSSTVGALGSGLKEATASIGPILATMQGMPGIIGKTATSLGPKIIGALASPIAAVGAVFAGGAIAIAAGFKEAYNAAREFDLQTSQKRVDESLSRVSDLFAQFEKDTTNIDFLSKIDSELSYGSKQLMKNLETDLKVPKAMWANLLDLGGSQAAGRSMILEKEGIGSYISSVFSNNAQQAAIGRIAPEKAVETAQKVQPQGQNILKQFENKLRSGMDMDTILAELNAAGNQSAEVLARMNPKINEQIMLIENDRNISEQRKSAIIKEITASEANRVASVNMKNSMKQIEFEKLGRQTNNFATSLERMFNGMEQAINKTDFELSKLSRSAELSAAALSGNAKAGDVMLDSINVLQNPRAYSGQEQGAAFDQAAGFFGSQADLVRPLLGLGDKLESTVMSTINRSVQANPTGSTEGIASNIRNALDAQLKDLGLPPNIADKLAGQTKLAFEKIRSERGGEDTRLNFDQITEEVPAFAKAISSAQRAQELAVKAMEFYQKNLNEYAQAMNQMVDFQIEANNRMRKASEVQAKGAMELAKTLGQTVSLTETRNVTEAPIRSMTGGLTNPGDIGRNVVNLEAQRRTLQTAADNAGNRGPAAKDEFAVMQNRLRNTNVALRENIDALKQMADSTDLAQAALAKIQEVQARRQAGANLIEKMVTSNPEELARLNASIGRLNNNMRGGLNVGSTAEQRGESLQAFNMLAPLLGDGQQQNELKANVLESMLKESGVGIDSTFQSVLDSLRNPEGDPQMAEAISVYRESLAKQTQANDILGELQRMMSENTAEIAATKLATAISSVPLTFDQQVFNDIRDNIQKLVEIVGKRDEEGKDPIPAQNKRKGGVIYASMGRAIDFAPKGTDTVPAMLTPGEFVVNRAATKANLPLLQNINSKKYSNGGKVRYYNEGGYVLAGGVATAGTGEDEDASKLEEAVNKSTEKQKTAKNTEQATKLKLPILEEYGDKDFKKLGTIQTDNFIAVGNRGKSGIGESFERIYLGEKIGTLYNNYGSITGTKKAELPKYQKSLFWGIQDIDSIIGSEQQLTKSDIYKNGKDGEFTDIILGYQSLYTKLMQGPSGNTKIETFIKEINTEPLPNISPNFSRKPKRRTGRDGDYKGYSYLKVVEDLIQDNEKSYWGIFDEIPRILKQGGVGFEGVSPFTLADSPAKFAAYVNTPPRVLAGKDLQQDNLDSYNKVDLVNNTIQVIQKTRQALKALSLFDDKILDPGEGAGEKIDTSTVESNASINNKETLASLDALYKNRIFHAPIGDPDFVKKPITLYNMAEEKWNTIRSDPNYQKAVDDNTAMSDWNDTISIIPIVNNKPNTENKRQFPWITNDTKLDPMILTSAHKEFNTEAGDALFKVTETPIGSAGGRFFIPAKTITGNLLNTTSRNYGSSYEYTYIPPKAGDPKLNPLYNTEKPILYAGTSLNEYLGARLPSWNTDTGETPPANPEFGSLSSLKLNGQYIGGISSVDPSEFGVVKDLPKDIKPYIIPSSDGTNPILESMTIDATEYQKARDERIKAKEMQLTKERASKVTGDRFKKLSTAESAFTTATRTKLAQQIQGYASTALSAYGIGVPSITKIEDVGGVAGYLNNYLKKIDNKSPQWAEINAWRALFSELYQPGGIGKDAESRIPATVAYLKTFGIDVENGTVNEDGIKQIIAREKAIAISKNVSGEIPEDSLKSLDLEASKTKLYTVDKDGNKTEIKSDNIKNPKTIQDVERIGLAPENLFENSEKRQSYLKVLSDYFTKNNLSEFAAAAEGLKPWYTAQDTLLNAGLNNDMLQGSLDALNGNAPKPETTAGGGRNLEDPVTTIGNKDNYIQHHKLLTADKYGELPDASRMKDLITVRIEESKTEEQKPEKQQALARGGIVYASNGSFINFRPKGTDTVPAMLTPGEFVINRASTQKYRPVLEAINNGNYSRGGIVNYLSGGGYLPLYREGGGGTPAGSGFDFTSFMNNIMVSVSSSITEAFNKAVSALKQPNNSSGGVSNSGGDISSIDNFVNRLNNIANILSNIYIPPQITITGKHDVVVTINGDTVLNQLRPDIAGIVMSAISDAFADFKNKNPENNTIDFNIDIDPNKFSGYA